MAHYTLAVSPYGNFAVSVVENDSSHIIEEFYLMPVGELAEIPFKGEYIDTMALEDEAVRQMEADGRGRARFLTPRPEYTINRVTYNEALRVTRYQWAYMDKPETRVESSGIGSTLTDSARAKLAAWWDSVRDDVITPRYLAEDKLERARYDAKRAERKLEEAKKALEEAYDEAMSAAASRAYAEQDLAKL